MNLMFDRLPLYFSVINIKLRGYLFKILLFVDIKERNKNFLKCIMLPSENVTEIKLNSSWNFGAFCCKASICISHIYFSAKHLYYNFFNNNYNFQNKYFDSGDYNMAKAKVGPGAKLHAGQKPTMILGQTGEAIPTPETVPHKKVGPLQSKLANPS